jgi:hypothetical protein
MNFEFGGLPSERVWCPATLPLLVSGVEKFHHGATVSILDSESCLNTDPLLPISEFSNNNALDSATTNVFSE